MSNTDAKLEGWILINAEGLKLTHHWLWSNKTEGWIWDDQEVEDFIYQTRTWAPEDKATHKQAAYLSIKTGHTILVRKPEAL